MSLFGWAVGVAPGRGYWENAAAGGDREPMSSFSGLLVWFVEVSASRLVDEEQAFIILSNSDSPSVHVSTFLLLAEVLGHFGSAGAMPAASTRVGNMLNNSTGSSTSHGVVIYFHE